MSESQKISESIGKPRKGEHKYVVIALRNPQPGALMWLLTNTAEEPVLRGLGLNPALEQEAIREAKNLVKYDEQVYFYPHESASLLLYAQLKKEAFPFSVIATLLNTLPGRTEILAIGPKAVEDEVYAGAFTDEDDDEDEAVES